MKVRKIRMTVDLLSLVISKVFLLKNVALQMGKKYPGKIIFPELEMLQAQRQ